MVERVLELNARIDRRRLPGESVEEVEDTDVSFELGWLYGIDIGEVVETYLAGKSE